LQTSESHPRQFYAQEKSGVHNAQAWAFKRVDLDKLDEEFRRHIVLLRFKR
jgi:hypothetical protein